MESDSHSGQKSDMGGLVETSTVSETSTVEAFTDNPNRQIRQSEIEIPEPGAPANRSKVIGSRKQKQSPRQKTR